MISVRIPKEIREYKEKILLGLTVRQLISTILALGIAIPLYVFGHGVINEEVLSWTIILIVVPLAGFGFFKYNGMPFERFVSVVFKQGFLYPVKRKFINENFFEEMQMLAEKEDRGSLTRHEAKELKKLRDEAGLERAFLLMEAEEKGQDLSLEQIRNLDERLLTVSNEAEKKRENIRKKRQKELEMKMKSKAELKSKTRIKAEEIQNKIKEDAYYLPTSKERKILLAYAKEIKSDRMKEIKKGKNTVKKKNSLMTKRKKAQTSIPKSTHDTIPYIADFEEGLFEVETNKYSKTIALQDINYLVAKVEEQEAIFCKYGEFLNHFTEDMNIQITIHNKVVSMEESEKQVLYKYTGDKYDKHRAEYNKILKRQMMAGNNEIQQSKYCTITIDANNPYEALLRFHKIQAEVLSNLQKLGVKGRVLSTDERLSLLHDIYRQGREGELKVNYDWLKEQGLSSKDYIAPSDFRFMRNIFNIDSRFCRVMFLNNLPASLADDFLHDLNDVDFPVMTTLNIQPVAQDKGLRLVKKQLTGMESNKIELEKKAMRSGYSPDIISHELKQSLAQAEELLDDMLNKNQKMYFVTITVMVIAETEEELLEHVDTLIKKARSKTCQLQNLSWQQEDAFKQTLPMGINRLAVKRTLTTESTSIFIPFATQNLYQAGGFYYGLNQINKNLIMCNRTSMKTPSGFILGSSGSGKSFATKREILNVLLNDSKTGVLIIDPENEYGDFAKAFGGTVLNMSTGTDCHINPMDMDANYGLDDNDDPETTPLNKKKEKAIQKKTDYLMSIIQYMISDGNNISTITPQQKTIVDRSIKRAYQKYLDNDFDEQYIPTLVNLQDELDKEKENSEDGRIVAEGVEYYTRGSMNMFSHKSNLDYSNRFVVFNIRDLGRELKQISLLIVLDFIWNRMISNYQLKIRTYCYVDEIHVLFQNEFSARYLQQLYKRGRKYGLVITGITQNMEDLLRSEMARGMIGNSDFIMMLNQATEDLKILANMLNISETQMSYVSMAEQGSGLLFAEDTIVPFIDRFPTDSYLYKLMSTKFGEDDNIDEILKEILESNKEKEMSTQESA